MPAGAVQVQIWVTQQLAELDSLSAAAAAAAAAAVVGNQVTAQVHRTFWVDNGPASGAQATTTR